MLTFAPCCAIMGSSLNKGIKVQTYTEAIETLADLKESPNYRYCCVAAFPLLAEIYGVDEETVYNDVANNILELHRAKNKARKDAARADQEARRLANIAKKQSTAEGITCTQL